MEVFYIHQPLQSNSRVSSGSLGALRRCEIEYKNLTICDVD